MWIAVIGLDKIYPLQLPDVSLAAWAKTRSLVPRLQPPLRWVALRRIRGRRAGVRSPYVRPSCIQRQYASHIITF